MEIKVPVYVETASLVAGKPPEYVVRPLFFDGPEAKSTFLQSALNKLTHRLRENLVELGKVQRHDTLAAWTFCPELETKRCEIRLEVAKQFARLKLLLVMIPEFDRRIGFTPAFPDVWFEITADQNPEERLTEAITEHLRRASRESHGESLPELERFSLKGNAWVSEIEFRLNPPRVREKKKDSLFAFLGASETVDGESELYRVGRCLNHQYPQDLNRVELREREVDELTRLLQADDRRPVLLLGARQVGKTSILHEYVFRHVKRIVNPHRDQQAVWLLSPQRLISGMSYVGQWETRFHAIVKHASLRDLVLYFDDLLGLFEAGVTSQSTLSEAALLKTALERRHVRVIGEMTPEAFRVLREKDRSFADAFHVIRISELSADDNLRVLFSQQRQLETRHRCRFAIDALPAVIDLQRRYARDVAFPGKAANFLKRLAVRVEGEVQPDASSDKAGTPAVISRERVLDAFHQQTGLPRSFLDQQQTLASDHVAQKLRERFVGQPDAVKAAVEIIAIARARLNDPTRPIASLLLLGPTGVGKTEFAKSLASYLFGHAERLMRFDMNEYVSPNAVPQLVGTFAQPEGLLTAAVRRQPFAVILFDEIEKGHPDIFDLLLQVLGEGRLTDARGRTTDFSNTIIVLTSNLGTQRSESGLGFGSAVAAESGVSVRAAENFFRPEFFNRLDRVIPFERLSRDDMQVIVRHLMSDVLHRDGLVRRQCVLNTSTAAVDWVIDQGYNPVLGARALKRAIERELTRPIATFLAGYSATTQQITEKSDNPLDEQSAMARDLMLIDIDRADRGLSVAVRILNQTAKTKGLVRHAESDFAATLAAAQKTIEFLGRKIAELKPASHYGSGRISAEQTRYLLVQDELPRLKTWVEELLAAHDAAQKVGRMGGVMKSGRSHVKQEIIRRRGPSHGDIVGRAAADDEIDDFLETRFDGPSRDVDLTQEPQGLLSRCRWVVAVALTEQSELDQAACVCIRSADPTASAGITKLVERLLATWTDELALEATLDPDYATGHNQRIHLRGALAKHYASVEAGFHVLRSALSASPKLLSVQLEGEEIPNVIVRTLELSEENPSKKNLVTHHHAESFPTVETLRQEAWEALPELENCNLKFDI